MDLDKRDWSCPGQVRKVLQNMKRKLCDKNKESDPSPVSLVCCILTAFFKQSSVKAFFCNRWQRCLSELPHCHPRLKFFSHLSPLWPIMSDYNLISSVFCSSSRWLFARHGALDGSDHRQCLHRDPGQGWHRKGEWIGSRKQNGRPSWLCAMRRRRARGQTGTGMKP